VYNTGSKVHLFSQRLSVIRGSIRTNELSILYCTQRLSVDSWIYQNKWTFDPVLYTTIKCDSWIYQDKVQYRIKSPFVLIDPRITLNRCVQYRIKSPFVLIDPRITLNPCVQYRIKSPFVLIDPRITLNPCVQYRIKSAFVLIDPRFSLARFIYLSGLFFAIKSFIHEMTGNCWQKDQHQWHITLSEQMDFW
jgi:hypothetical protein